MKGASKASSQFADCNPKGRCERQFFVHCCSDAESRLQHNLQLQVHSCKQLLACFGKTRHRHFSGLLELYAAGGEQYKPMLCCAHLPQSDAHRRDETADKHQCSRPAFHSALTSKITMHEQLMQADRLHARSQCMSSSCKQTDRQHQ